MIKKSVHEDELIAGMQRELQPFEKKAAVNNLVNAADYLNAAMEIFEEAGMTAKADQVLNILRKIAVDTNEVKRHKSDFEPGEVISMRSLLNQDSSLKPGDEISMTSLAPRKKLPPGEDFIFESLMNNQGTEDLLDLDINDAAIELQEEPSEDKTFEDSD